MSDAGDPKRFQEALPKPKVERTCTVITADAHDAEYWQDIWRHRELAMFLAWRDLVVRYRQTFIGVAWTILRPLASVLVYTMVFGVIANLPSDGLPYSLLVLTGLLPWQLFSLVLIVSSESLNATSALINKLYFPKILIPASSIAVPRAREPAGPSTR